MFRVIDELIAQPIRWNILVCAVDNNSARVLEFRFCGVLIRPVVFTSRRVEALKFIRFISASDCGLLDVTDLFRPSELIQLLEPHNANISEFRFDGLNLEWIIRASEIDLLPGRLVCDLKRG